MSQRTTDHEEIRQWAKARGAVPAELKPLKFDGEPAILTFLFSGKKRGMDEAAEIEWDHFFALFDLMGLALVYDGDNGYELLQIEGQSPYRFEGKPV